MESNAGQATYDGEPGAGIGTQLLVLLGLTGLAITQPLLSVLGESPTIFTFYNVTGTNLVLYVLVLALVPSLLLWLPSLMLHAVGRRHWAWWIHSIVASVLFGLAAEQFARELGLANVALRWMVLVGAAMGFGYALWHWDVVWRWARLLVVLPVIALGSFLLVSPSSDLVSVPSGPDPAEGGGATTPVVFLMLDEFPTRSLLDEDGDIDDVRFPALAEFAESATWYPNYSTLSPITETAVPSIVSGQDPIEVQPLFAEYPDTLFTRMAPTHHLSVFESFTQLCGFPDCTEAPPGQSGGGSSRWSALTDRVVGIWTDRVVPDREPTPTRDEFFESLTNVTNLEERFIAGDVDDLAAEVQQRTLARPERMERFTETFVAGVPALYYLHLVLPHFPFRFYADGTVYGVDDTSAFYPHRDNNDTEWLSALSQQRHLSQAGYTDQLVGVVIDRLRDVGLFDEALVVVVADHGASFDSGTPYRLLNERTIDATAFSPLFIKEPAQTVGVVDQSNVMAIDILPSIAEIVGFEIAPDLPGVPIGSDQMAARGDAKYAFDHRAELFGGGTGDAKRLSFTTDDAPSSASERLVGPILEGQPELTGLYTHLGITDLLGRELDDLVTGTGGQASIHRLGELLDPDEGNPVGIVQGRIDPGIGTTVLVAVDGVVVAGSPVFAVGDEPHRFAALLPPEVVGSGEAIRIAVLDGSGANELSVEAD